MIDFFFFACVHDFFIANNHKITKKEKKSKGLIGFTG